MLSSEGGDVWTFRKRIEGRLEGGTCEQIVVATPSGRFRATRFGDSFAAVVTLDEGRNEVRALCRRGESDRASSSPQYWTVRIEDRPKAWARAVATHAGLVLDGGGSETAPARPAPIVRYEWRVSAAGAPVRAPLLGERVTLTPPGADGDYEVTLRVTDALGRTDEAATIFRVREGKAVSADLAREHPAWVDNAVIYGVVPFLFGPRGLADVTDRLDEIAALGATAIWLSPITESPRDDFGYAVTDHFAVRSSFGGEVDLRALVEAAHARGLRVILDLVPNHVSIEHPYYVDAARRGASSPYATFFDRDARGEATHYFDWPHLKNLDFHDPQVQGYIIEASARWVRDFDVDGFRVDVSWGIRERAPEFWPRWRAELKRIKPDIFLLAEASACDPYYFVHGFDAAYDWTEKLGQWAWSAAFEGGKHLATRLKAALDVCGDALDPDALVFRFLENNDTGARFVTRYGPDRTRVAAAMLLTLPGIPMIYTGQEIGAEFKPYGQRHAIDWSRDPHGLYETYRQLIRLRRTHAALRGRTLHVLETRPADDILAYLRPAPKPEDAMIVLLNYSGDPASAELEGDGLQGILGAGRFVDLLSGEIITLAQNMPEVPVPAFGARVLRRMEAAVQAR